MEHWPEGDTCNDKETTQQTNGIDDKARIIELFQDRFMSDENKTKQKRIFRTTTRIR